MRIWLITIGEPLPTDGAGTRLLRTGILAARLAARGHEVVWWTSAFDHNRKKARVSRDSTVQLQPGLTAKLLSSPIGYRRNISLARLANHYHLARRFRRQAQCETPPDIILSSLPTAELSLEAVRYGAARGIPVVLDARDMWPDLIVDAIPPLLKRLARPAVRHLRRVVEEACRGASAIVGITPAFVDWALGYAHRPRGPYDLDFPLSNDAPATADALSADAVSFWRERGVGVSAAEFNLCFFGNIGSPDKYDWPYVIDAAAALEARALPVRIVMCGEGDGLAQLRHQATACRNIVFAGWVNGPQIRALMHLSRLGLLPYSNRRDFAASYPNKAIEYLSAGLPLLSSLDGELGELLTRHDAGIVYRSAAELCDSVAQLCEAPQRLAILSENARALYEQRFHPEMVYNAFIEHLEAIARQPQAQSLSAFSISAYGG